MKYLLLVVFLNNGSTTVKTQSFNSEAQCTMAAKAVIGTDTTIVLRKACLAIG